MNSATPALARGCRFRRSANSAGTLLVPEGVVELNSSASAIVELIDGKRTVEEITLELSERTALDLQSMSSDVQTLLQRLAAKCWLVVGDKAALP
ncbi:MAG: pyrroloquinoline quinone biosynthesis peptide chaperone PqqD [Candidatus Eremiobacter antarcticus]|nr:pyrroloquinoline quinone biosynthesis peptide chaperone PqqD [Candidatus Eremiobacteraeota bacterium]MBC5808297.1 pyrroloquinoline quinone biosynthesis peptide chaperone PqqD [Candidatus Eremiobacteraeota bacterium]